MNRPYSWYPLASSDPVPGDPGVVRAGGDHYREIAAAIGDAERVLRALVDAQEAVSDAVDAIRDRTHAVADSIRKAYDRYHAAGDALVVYSLQLDRAQTQSLDALHLARSAQHDLDAAETAVRRSRLLLDDATDLGEDVITHERALTTARAERADAETDLARARTVLEEAVGLRDAAASQALETLDAGMHGDELDDGWWEDWGADVAQVVSTCAGRIATGAGLLTLVLGWVPVLGQILAVVSLAAGAAALVADLALALKRGDGEDWANVVTGVVGIVTFGAGKALAKSAQAFVVSSRTTAATAAARADRSLLSRVLRVLARASGGRQVSSASATSLKSEVVTGRPLSYRDAWAQVRNARGWDRALTLAGHGDLVAQNNALRSQLWEISLLRPKAFITLAGPTAKGTALEAGASVLYVTDGSLNLVAAGTDAVDATNGPDPTPADRVRL